MKRIKRLKLILAISVFIVIFSVSSIFGAKLPKKFPFKKENALDEWEEKIFKGRVIYSVKVKKTDGYLSAYSKNTASGIIYRIRFYPKREPMVSWKWKVLKFPKKEKLGTSYGDWIEQDDYAARFYVIFPRLAFNLTKSLEYVWDKDLPEGTIITSPYSKNIKIIVIESGNRNLRRWVFEERDVYEDFKKAFGREPGEVGAIAIMTDTDNTASTAEAHYDEIKVGYKKDEGR